jgi:hypothetical protein
VSGSGARIFASSSSSSTRATARRGATSSASRSTPTMSPRSTSTSPVRSAGRAAGCGPSGRRGRGRRACPCRGAPSRGRRAGALVESLRARLERARPRRGRRRPRRGRESASAAMAAESRSYVPRPLGGLDLEDLELQRAARRGDLDGLALLVADDRLADRRLVRELVLGRVRLGGADDVVLDRLVRVMSRSAPSSRPRRRPSRSPSS